MESSARIGLILGFLVMAAGVQSATADPILSSPCNRYLKPQSSDTSRFDLESFVRAKRELKSRMQSGELSALKGHVFSPEEMLALFEVQSAGKGWDLFQFERLLSESPELHKKIARLMVKYDFNKGISRDNVEQLIIKLYLLSNPGNGSIEGLIRRGFGTEQRSLIRARVESELAARGISDALFELGLLRSSSVLEKFRSWRAKHSAWESAGISLAVNTIVYLKLGPYPTVPSLSAIRSKRLTEPQITRIKEHGLEKALPEIEKQWGLAAAVTLSTQVLRRLMFCAYGIMAGYFAINELPTMKSLFGTFLTTKGEVIGVQARSTADEIRKRQFISWQEAYEDIKGSELDTVTNPADRELAREQWFILNSIPEEQLRLGDP